MASQKRKGGPETCQSKKVKRHKIFHDPVHGDIEINDVCVSIIDTPVFQRLRRLKQLGSCYYVYPGASHNRFEHSIGVCHLAGRLVRRLQETCTFNDVHIDEEDILCVEIAGLCHDLGHGPLSHSFDQKFIPMALEGEKWTHEDGSVDMFKYMIEKYELKQKFLDADLDEDAITFIQELITGEANKVKTIDQYKNKLFLFEIVANQRNKVDVDKFDYFARDNHAVGFNNKFNHDRFIRFARVAEYEGEKHICTRDKEIVNLYEMYRDRKMWFWRVNKHPVCCIIEFMTRDAFLLANAHLDLKDKNGKPLSMAECIHDMEAFSKLDDGVISLILEKASGNEAHKDLKEAKAILDRIETRNLYTLIAEIKLHNENTVEELDCIGEQSQQEKLKRKLLNGCDDPKPEEDEIFMDKVDFDYGMGNQDPLKNILVYSKSDPSKAQRIKNDSVSHTFPKEIKVSFLRVFCKNEKESKKAQNLAKSFLEWIESKAKLRILRGLAN